MSIMLTDYCHLLFDHLRVQSQDNSQTARCPKNLRLLQWTIKKTGLSFNCNILNYDVLKVLSNVFNHPNSSNSSRSVIGPLVDDGAPFCAIGNSELH